MSIHEKLSEIRRFCRAHADPAIVRKYSRFFVEGYDAYGLQRGILERQKDLWLEKWAKELGFRGFLDLGDLLVQSGKYEEGSCALWFAAAFKDRFTAGTLDRLGRWLDGGFRNWAHTDVFSGEVLSHFLKRGIVPIEAFSRWRDSGSKWKRRAVPVTLLEVLDAGPPVPRLLRFVEPMMLDPEKVVQQGLGWFLREAWKRHPGEAERFLLRWKDSCPRLIIQYATEKMPPARKAKFRRAPAARKTQRRSGPKRTNA